MTTLNDTEIGAEIDAGRLIRNADPERLAGACYELRMGSVYYDLSEGGKRFELAPDEAVMIKPGHRVVLITQEDLVVPADVLVRVVSKGSLFSVGLSPVATYADPGFGGNLGIVTCNISDKYIVLPQGEPIAKADFTRLSSAAARPYKGQHGFNTGIWPIKTQLQRTHAQIAGDHRVRSEQAEALELLPEATRIIIRRLERSQSWINYGLVLAIVMNATALFAVNRNWMTNFEGILANFLVSAAIGIGSLIINRFRKI